MALQETLTLNISKAQADIKKLGVDIQKQFTDLKVPPIKLPPIDVPKASIPDIPAPRVGVPDLSGIRNSFTSLGHHAANIGRQASQAMAGIGAAAVVVATTIAGTAVKASTEFELSLSRIVGLTNLSKDTVNGFKDSIIALGGETGRAPQELAHAMYFVASAGTAAENIMGLVEISARAAAAGMGETDVIARVLTGAMNAYGAANLSASRAGDILTQAVKEGAAEAADFAQEIGPILPVAAKLGIGLEEVSAGMASLTNQGINAAESATALRQVLFTILSPTAQGKAALDSIGLSAAGLRQELDEKGLIATLGHFAEATKDNAELQTEFFGNIRAAIGALAFMGPAGAEAAAILQRVTNSTGSLNESFAVFTETSTSKIQKLRSTLKGIAIQIGDELQPAFKTVLDSFQNLASFAQVPAFAAILSEIGDIAERVAQGIKTALANLRAGLGQINVGQVSVAFAQLNGFIDELGQAFQGLEPLIAAVGVALAVTFGRGLPLIGGFIGAFKPLPILLLGLVGSSQAGRDALGELGKTLTGIASTVLPILGRTLQEVGPSLGKTFSVLVTQLGPPIQSLIVNIAKLAEVVLPLLASALESGIGAAAGILGAGLGALSGILGALADIGPVATGALIALGVAFASIKIIGFVDGLVKTVTHMSALSGTMLAAAPIIGGLALIAGGLAAVFAKNAEQARKAREEVQEYTRLLEESGSSMTAAKTRTVDLVKENEKLRKVLAETGIGHDQVAEAINGSDEAFISILEQISATGSSLDELNSGQLTVLKALLNDLKSGNLSTADFFKIMDEGFTSTAVSGEIYNLALKEGVVNEDGLGDAVKNVTDVLGVQRDTVDKSKEALSEQNKVLRESEASAKAAAAGADEMRDAFDKLAGGTVAVEKANIDFHASIAALSTALQQNGANLDVNSEAGRNNRDAILGTRDAAIDYAASLIEHNKDVDGARTHLNGYIDSLKTQLTQSGLSEQAVDAYLQTLGLTPSQVDTTINAITGVAEEKIGGVKTKLVDLGNGVQILVRVDDSDAIGRLESFKRRVADVARGIEVELGIGGTVRVRQHGGPVEAHQPYIVGEKRPELFVPKVPGVILPRVPTATHTGRALSTMHEIPNNIVNVYVNPPAGMSQKEASDLGGLIGQATKKAIQTSVRAI